MLLAYPRSLRVNPLGARSAIVVLILFLGSLCASSTVAAAPSIGDAAPPFSAQSIDGQNIDSNQYKGKIIVLEWLAPNSPYSTKYYSKSTSNGVGYIQSLQRRFTQPSVGVVWLSIASIKPSSPEFLTAELWKQQLATWGALPTALIQDEAGKIARIFGVTIIPEVCIIDRSGKLVYRGAIDSMRGSEPSDIDRVANMRWFQQALENVVQGRSVYTSETIPYGIRIETEDDHSILF